MPACTSPTDGQARPTGRDLRFAILGTGFWSHVQLAAWRELKGAECIALYNRTQSEAQALAATFGIPAAYGDAEALLRSEHGRGLA